MIPLCAGQRLGLELEMPVAHRQGGQSQPVFRYFASLAQIKYAHGLAVQPVYLSGRCVGLRTPQADCGLDNGFNLLETALAPVSRADGGLARLAAVAQQELADTLTALGDDGLTVLNASQHPVCGRDKDWYSWVRVPRPIYGELVHERGWRHFEGIDAKAQNGVNVSVPVSQAVRALNATIGTAAASIAIFANSPLESGRLTGLRENRLTVWPRVYRQARFESDRRLERYPEQPFHDLGHYFRWMFSCGSVSRSLPLTDNPDYKAAPSVILDRHPGLRQFLGARCWPGRRLDNGQQVSMRPQASHFVHSQIAVFLDGRFRYRLDRMPSLARLLAAWEEDGGLEALFAQCGIDCYIEGRAPGANFADPALLTEAGPEVARSVLLAPMALQLGLLRRLDETDQLLRDWGWVYLGRLRARAIRNALADDAVHRLCREVLAIARRGLAPQERGWLAYADYVVASRRCGADRFLESWQALPTQATAQEHLRRLLPRHTALNPHELA